MPIKFDLSEYTKTHSIFIETGTLKGDGVRRALQAGFQHVYSIELDNERFTKCNNNFKQNKKVTIIHGDSGIELPKLLNTIHKPCVLWLDAHYCGDGAELAEKWTPINEEIETLRNHPIKTHVILVDDLRCMDNTHVDEKTQKEVGFPGKQKLLEQLQEINPNYKLDFLDGHVKTDVVRAMVH